MSIWSDHFENRDPARYPISGDQWANGALKLSVVGALFGKDGRPVLVVYDDSTLGRIGCTGGTWKRTIGSFQCKRRAEQSFTPETMAALKHEPGDPT